MLKQVNYRFCAVVKLYSEWQQISMLGGGAHNPRRAHLRITRGLRTSRLLGTPVKPFVLSDIGEGIKQVVIKQWHVKEGDVVQEFDDICDVESDKAFTTITSKYKGTIKRIHHDRDAVALVGQPLVDIETEDGDILGTTSNDVKKDDGKQHGGASLQTAGSVGSSENAIKVGATRIEQEPRSVTDDHQSEALAERTLATPAVRRLIRENRLSLNEIRGTGREGRVLKEDVLDFMANNKTNQVHDGTQQHYEQLKSPAQSIPPGGPSQDTVFRVDGLRKHMVRSMTVSNSIPTLVYYEEVDVSTLARWRQEFKPTLEKRNIKLSFLPFMMKAISLSIIKYPIVNATLDEKCEKITYKSAHNIGFAAATPKGLIVPNIKNVRNLSIIQIAQELERLTSLAQAGTLSPSDISGGTITISNIGSIGGIYYRPLINPPEVVIAATGRIQSLPRYDSAGELRRADIINVSWAADHRIIDGATMAGFSNTWKEYIENPSSLLLGLVAAVLEISNDILKPSGDSTGEKEDYSSESSRVS